MAQIMRRSGWLIAVPVVLIWLCVIVLPGIGLVAVLLEGEPAAPSTPDGPRSVGSLIATTLIWSVSIGIGAMMLGWWPGRWLRRRTSSGRWPVWSSMIILAPILLPAYVVYWCWWQAWPAGSAFFEYAVEHDLIAWLRGATLAAGLICWSWPLAAWCVSRSVSSQAHRLHDLRRLDGASVRARLGDAWREDRRGLMLGGLFVALLTAGNTTCFDLSEVFTFGNELRAQRSLGATPAMILRFSAVPMLIQTAAVCAAWLLLSESRLRTVGGTGAPWASRRMRLWMTGFTLVLVAVSVLVPWSMVMKKLAVMLSGPSGRSSAEAFVSLYGEGIGNTATIAAVVGVLAGICAPGLGALWMDQRVWVRRVAHVMAVTWLLAAVIPGTITGLALESTFNRSGPLAGVYQHPVILVIGHMARFGFIAVLFGRWMAVRESSRERDCRLLDGAGSLRLLYITSRPRFVAAMAATTIVVLIASFSEIPVTALVRPAGFDSIQSSILNAMHYQQPDVVMFSMGAMMLASVLAAILTMTIVKLSVGRDVVRHIARGSGTAMLLLLLMMMSLSLVGCGGAIEPEDARPMDVEFIFGSSGRSPGQFDYPRAISVDKERSRVFVVDKTARIQRFDLDGELETFWQMPEWENGKPTGLTVAPDGNVWVADTHYYRILVYDADGEELLRFGSYGRGPGQFIYPTDIAFHPETGHAFVAEYGGNDRIQVFDRDGTFLYVFGEQGSETGELNRPQALQFSADGSELYIADACNHRIHVFAPDGTPIRVMGSVGQGAGQLSYPYDVTVLPDGSLMIAEFGNNRLQRMGRDGAFLGVFGLVGFDEGCLQYPWGVDGTEDRLFVLDSGNRRVQVIDTP